MKSEQYDEYDLTDLDDSADAIDVVEEPPGGARRQQVMHFGLRAAALASLVVPVAMVVGGLAGGILSDGGSSVAFTTCCP